MIRATLLAVTGLVAVGQNAPALPGTTVRVPRGAAVTIDAKTGDTEWGHAATQRLTDGTVIRFQRDDRHLFLGIAAARRGFPSVCAVDGDTVRIFHASAALGHVSYTRAGRGWTTRDTEFVYGMRTTDLGEQAREERRAYLARHGWLASTFGMSDGRTQEMQISLDFLSRPARLALAYFTMNGNQAGDIIRWPESMPAGDGCANRELVSGRVPADLRFDPDTWAAIEIGG